MRIFKIVMIVLLLTIAISFMISNISPTSAADDKVNTETLKIDSKSIGEIKTIKVSYKLSNEAKKCIDCHAKLNPGIVTDWKNSRHSHAGVSCIDCHQVEKDSKLASQACDGVKGTDTYITLMVTPKTCEKCHPQNVEEFNKSGHFRARKQYIPKKDMNDLIYVHEGRNHPKYKGTSEEVGCMQCHGSIVELDKDNRPLKGSYPNPGIGTIWPDGSVGNCVTCHTRHKFDIAEARKPQACAACHLGPDHPDIEIYESSKHGNIFKAESSTYKFDDPSGAWEVSSFRVPTCATCHMSGIGDLNTTHNISKRLHWNLWDKRSVLRNSEDPMSSLTGNGIEGRKEMKLVCANCHTNLHTDNYFQQGDDAVAHYNENYFDVADKWKKELESKKLLKANPWDDEFQKKYYFLWHHEGRRARQASLMMGPDYAHWHGFFELMEDIYEMEAIYNKRIKENKIEE